MKYLLVTLIGLFVIGCGAEDKKADPKASGNADAKTESSANTEKK